MARREFYRKIEPASITDFGQLQQCLLLAMEHVHVLENAERPPDPTLEPLKAELVEAAVSATRLRFHLQMLLQTCERLMSQRESNKAAYEKGWQDAMAEIRGELSAEDYAAFNRMMYGGVDEDEQKGWF